MATHTLKLTRIGNSTGVILPREILKKLRVDRGDMLSVIETADGIELTPYDPDFAAQMQKAESVMRQDRDDLRRLGELAPGMDPPTVGEKLPRLGQRRFQRSSSRTVLLGAAGLTPRRPPPSPPTAPRARA